MKIYIGADHRGFELKNQLKDWLVSQGHEVEDCGDTQLNQLDDYVDFTKRVAENVQHDQELTTDNRQLSLGIVICGSGVGVSVAANRYKGIVCALGFDVAQVQHARENDHANILSLPSEYIDFEKAKEMVTVFLSATPKTEEKYIRRLRKLDSIV